MEIHLEKLQNPEHSQFERKTNRKFKSILISDGNNCESGFLNVINGIIYRHALAFLFVSYLLVFNSELGCSMILSKNIFSKL